MVWQRSKKQTRGKRVITKICRASLSKYEHNAGHIPISVLIELVKLYKIDLDWILDNKEQ